MKLVVGSLDVTATVLGAPRIELLRSLVVNNSFWSSSDCFIRHLKVYTGGKKRELDLTLLLYFPFAISSYMSVRC